MSIKALRARVNNWWHDEGASQRWNALRTGALISDLLSALNRQDEAKDKEMLRQLVFDMSVIHVNTCRRQHYDTRGTVWDAEGCTRCRGEQALEDLYTAFEAEERDI